MIEKQIKDVQKSIDDLYKLYMNTLDDEEILVAAITNLLSYRLDLEWRLKDERNSKKDRQICNK